MDPEHLERLCADYGLGEVQELSDVTEGILNKNYVLSTGQGKFFIKQVRKKTLEFLPETVGVEKLMFARSIPAVCMLETRTGESFVSYDADSYCVYPFLESDRTHQYSLEDYRTMGSMLGQIHASGSHDIPEFLTRRQWKDKSKEEVVRALEEYRRRIQDKPEIDQADKDFLEYIELKLELIPTLNEDTSLENTTLVHGDYHPGNLLIDSESREIIGVCDWEKAEMAPRSTELARAVLYSCFMGEYEIEPSLERVKYFLDGYKTANPISDEELRTGFEIRLRRHAVASWMENHYYDLGDARGNHFVPHETRLIRDFLQGDVLPKLLAS